MHQKLIDKLNKREHLGTLRELSISESCVDFYSNDYLGFARDNNVQFNLKGASGSRLISGNSFEALHCETFLAGHFNVESALVFNSGYAANLGLLSSVPQRGDVILYDERIHASAKEGMRLSFADSFAFKHHNYSDLERLLKKFQDKVVYVVVESLYSMDGTMAHFRKLTALCNEYDAFFIVDEAHSAGVIGEAGRGVVSAMELENEVFARIVTFGKSYGLAGAAVLGAENLTKYLVNFARSFIYTTALPAAVYQLIQENVGSNLIPHRQKELQKNIALFRNHFTHEACISEINSPIQIIQVGNVEKTHKMASRLHEGSLMVKPIYAPTVPEGQECLRICLHSFDQPEDIVMLAELLNQEITR